MSATPAAKRQDSADMNSTPLPVRGCGPSFPGNLTLLIHAFTAGLQL